MQSILATGVRIDVMVIFNPSDKQALEAYHNCASNLIKTIYDASGNLYLWDGELFQHQEVMARHGIPDFMYVTAGRIYKDFGGEQALLDVVGEWRSSVKDRQFADGAWE